MGNKALMVLVQESAALETALIESGGEITPEIEALLVVKDLHLPEKIDSYAMVTDRMDAVAQFYKLKADMFLRMAKSAESVIDRCEANIKAAMTAMATDEIKGNDIRYKLQKSPPACEIPDENLIDAGYKITQTITKVDKKRITEDLKLGVPVLGAKLTYGTSLRRYAATPTKKMVTA